MNQFRSHPNHQMNDPNNYKDKPLQKHYCTDSGIQSKLSFASEKTNDRQQWTHTANSEGVTLALLPVPGHKFVGVQPTSLCLTNNSRQSRSFVGDVSIDSWQCQIEISKVKSKSQRVSQLYLTQQLRVIRLHLTVRRCPTVLRKVLRILNKEGLQNTNLFHIFE